MKTKIKLSAKDILVLKRSLAIFKKLLSSDEIVDDTYERLLSLQLKLSKLLSEQPAGKY